jgi:predicted phosphodiesterase
MAKNKLEKILLISDVHVPYHDKKAFNLVLEVGKKLKVDQVVIGGDFIDNYSVSSHDKNPNRECFYWV